MWNNQQEKTKQDTKSAPLMGEDERERDIQSKLRRAFRVHIWGTEQLMQLQVLGPALVSHRA